ncbi:MAG: HAD hydrolase-like protein [Bacteroidota bacterium]
MSSKTFLLFDIDGTLLYSNAIDSQCFATSYQAEFRKPFPTIDWSKFPHVTDHVIFRTAFHQHFERYPEEEERQGFQSRYLVALEEGRANQPEDFKEVPGSAAIWRQLAKDDRFVLGLATGGWRAPAQIKLAHVGIDPVPRFAAYADGMESRDDILQAAIDLAEREHQIERTVYIGDALWDVTTTRRMSLPMIGVSHDASKHRLVGAGLQTIIRNYQNADRFLEAVEQATVPA